MSNVRAFKQREEEPEAVAAEAVAVSLLPVPLTSFVERTRETEEILSLLDAEETRLLTLMGPGGVGKTRLALEVARRVEDDFADGARFLSLISLQHPDQVPAEVARLFEVHERSGARLLDLLVNKLRLRHVLLVLDNVEHLLAEPPAWLGELLARCPRIKVLATSRAALNVTGEQRYVIPPMAVPDYDDANPESMASVALFLQRARAIRPGFVLTPENARSVGQICQRLDGLPLAIELAAARARVMTPAEISADLRDRTRLLAGGQRDVPRRLKSMRDSIAWGHDLLTDDERRVFRELTVFSGGFRLEAAERVVQPGAVDAASAVSSLIDASFLQPVNGSGRESRFLMLETIREFGLGQLAGVGDEDAVRHRHADWCLALVRKMGPVDPVRDTSWFDRIEEERANLMAAIAWLDRTERLDDLATLIVGTRWQWYLPGRQAEGLEWFDRVLHRHPTMDDVMRCDVLCWAGHLAQMIGRPDAEALLEQSLALAKAGNDTFRQGEVTVMLAVLLEDRGEYARAETHFRAAGDLHRQAGSDWAQHTIDYHLGIVEYGQGRLARAAKLLDTTRIAAEAFGEQLVPVWTRNFLALIACEQGEPERAIAVLKDMPGNLAASHRHDLPTYLGAAGVTANACGQDITAARLFGAVARLEANVMLPERAAFERSAAATRRRLGGEVYTTEYERGRRMRLEQVEAEVSGFLAGSTGVTRHASGATSRVAIDLTRREHEVLKLLADGQTNREIAETLFLSQRTVANHVDHILAKLDARSRTAAVAFAIRNGLA